MREKFLSSAFFAFFRVFSWLNPLFFHLSLLNQAQRTRNQELLYRTQRIKPIKRNQRIKRSHTTPSPSSANIAPSVTCPLRGAPENAGETRRHPAASKPVPRQPGNHRLKPPRRLLQHSAVGQNERENPRSALPRNSPENAIFDITSCRRRLWGWPVRHSGFVAGNVPKASRPPVPRPNRLLQDYGRDRRTAPLRHPGGSTGLRRSRRPAPAGPAAPTLRSAELQPALLGEPRLHPGAIRGR